jgi:nucleoside-diphosphate-sugar epimerase
MKVTILGASGPIGTALASHLRSEKDITMLQLAARSYEDKRQGKILYKKVDLLSPNETEEAIKGFDLVYVTVGLPYKTSVWEKDWPILIQNVINACEKYKVKLVFFDNVYGYGLVNGPMTELTPLQPNSKKGQVRKQIHEKIIEEVRSGRLTAVIAKSADFYGPYAKASLFYIQNIENIVKGKKPMWMGNAEKLHSFTFIPDAARALVILGMDSRANNKVWHIPTANALTGAMYMELIMKAMDVPVRYSTVNKTMLRLFGLFNSDGKELVEMFYQYDHEYVFDSSLFQSTFKITPTPYDKGIKETVSSFKTK